MRPETVARLMLLGVAGLLLLGLNISCGGNDTKPPAKTATVTATQPPPPPTFQQQRDAAVRFLRQMIQASNDFEDAITAASIEDKLVSGDFLHINDALTTLTQQINGYQQRVGELTPPLEVPDLAAFKAGEVRWLAKFQEVLQEHRLGIQAGSEAQIEQAVEAVERLGQQLNLDPDLKKPLGLQHAILARFNIPDAEVGYRRPGQ